MTEEITTVKYLIDQLVDVRVACQFWIDKDYESQARIKELFSYSFQFRWFESIHFH